MDKTYNAMPQTMTTVEDEQQRNARIRAAYRLADQLGEMHSDPREAIQRIVHVYGLEFAHEHFERALVVKIAGSLPRPDGKPRTLGGVFFQLVKQSLGIEAFRQVVPAQWKVAKERRNAAKRQTAEAASDTTRVA